jgi:hypothetical protein
MDTARYPAKRLPNAPVGTTKVTRSLAVRESITFVNEVV